MMTRRGRASLRTVEYRLDAHGCSTVHETVMTRDAQGRRVAVGAQRVKALDTRALEPPFGFLGAVPAGKS